MDNDKSLVHHEGDRIAETPDSKSIRIPFAIVLISLLVLIAVAIVARLSIWQRQQREYDEYLQVMRGAGARYNELAAMVQFSPRATDESLAVLPHVIKRGASRISLTDTKVTDEGIRRIDGEFVQMEGWNGPQDLLLGNTAITNDALMACAGFTNLVSLDLHDTIVDGEGLRHLVNLPELRGLVLNGTNVTDAGLEHVGAMKKIEWLNVANTGVTGDGLLQLTDLPRLDTLFIDATQATDEALLALREMPSLRGIRLEGPVSDKHKAYIYGVFDGSIEPGNRPE